MTRDMQSRVRAHAERVRAEIFSSQIPNLHQASQVNRTLQPSLPLPMENLDKLEETADRFEEESEETSIRLNIVVEPQLLSLLDECIHMNIALDRAGAAEAMIRLGCKISRDLILAHAEQRVKLQEIREQLQSSLDSEEV